MFARKGLITVPSEGVSEDKLTEIALEAGAEDLAQEGETWEITTSPDDFEAVVTAVKGAGLSPEVAEVTMVPTVYTKLEGMQATATLRLLETLEDLDDTQNVYTNFDMDDMAAAG